MIKVNEHVYFKLPVVKMFINEDLKKIRRKDETEFVGEYVAQAEEGMIFVKVLAMKIAETNKWKPMTECVYVEVYLDDVEV